MKQLHQSTEQLVGQFEQRQQELLQEKQQKETLQLQRSRRSSGVMKMLNPNLQGSTAELQSTTDLSSDTTQPFRKRGTSTSVRPTSPDSLPSDSDPNSLLKHQQSTI